MTPLRTQFKDLLCWMRDQGIQPLVERKDDQFLNPFTNKIQERRNMQPHQIRCSYWIPNLKKMVEILPDLFYHFDGEVIFVLHEGYVGAGFGEREAVLSLFNDKRKALLC